VAKLRRKGPSEKARQAPSLAIFRAYLREKDVKDGFFASSGKWVVLPPLSCLGP